MSSYAVAHASRSAADRSAEDCGRRFGVWSLLMLPMIVPSFVVSFVLSVWLLSIRDLEGSEPMSEQGLYGWVVLVVATLILLAPMIVGVVLGAKSWRLRSGFGVAGTVINGAVLVVLPVLIVVGALGQ